MTDSFTAQARRSASRQIKCRDAVTRLLSWFESSIGDNSKIHVRWLRNGKQSIEILSRGNWNAESIYGTMGSVIIAVDVTGKSFKPIEAGYCLSGDDLSVNLRGSIPISLLSPRTDQAAGSTQYGFAISTSLILSALSVFWGIISSTFEIQIPGDVGFTLSYDNDNPISVVFENPISVSWSILGGSSLVKAVGCEFSESGGKIFLKRSVIASVFVPEYIAFEFV